MDGLTDGRADGWTDDGWICDDRRTQNERTNGRANKQAKTRTNKANEAGETFWMHAGCQEKAVVA